MGEERAGRGSQGQGAEGQGPEGQGLEGQGSERQGQEQEREQGQGRQQGQEQGQQGRGPELDHLGIAVRSVERARRLYEGVLGLLFAETETIEREQVRVAMAPAGQTRIELLEPLREDSVVGRFLARRGEGLHHIALRVTDLDARFRGMQAAGMRLASDGVGVGAGGHRYFFVHPDSAGGVLLELVERVEDAVEARG